MKAIIFARGMDREQQAEICSEYAATNDIKIIGIESEWNRVEQYVYNMKIDVIIIPDPTVVSQGMIEYLTIEDNLSKFDVKIIAVK